MLPRKHRVHLRRDVARVHRARRRVHGDLFTIRAFQRGDAHPTRFIISVSRRVSPKATERNLVTRRVRAALRNLLPTINVGYDILIVAHRKFPAYSFQECHRDLQMLFQRARLLHP